MKKVLLIGTHGQHNWGDEILLQTFLRGLGKQNKYRVNTYDKKDTLEKVPKDYSVKVFHTTKDLPKLPLYILRSNVLFFAGGSIIKELYSNTGRKPYSSMKMVKWLVWFAKVIGRKKVIMSNIGMGPIKTKKGKKIAGKILKLADYVSFRDQESYNLAIEYGGNPEKMEMVADAVFFNTKEDLSAEESKVSNVLKIGLNLNYNIENSDNWDYFVETLAEVLKRLARSQKIEIHTIPMQTKFNPHNDVVTLDEFKKLLPDIKFVEHVPQTTKELADLINSCDFIFAERLHALVISTILNKPFFALNYDVKIGSLVQQLGMEEYSVDINKKFTAGEMLSKMNNLIKDRDKVVKNLKEKYAQRHEKVSKYFERVNEIIKGEAFWTRTKRILKKIVKNEYFIVFAIALVINIIIFRGPLMSYGEILSGTGTLTAEELVPIFDLKSQFIDGLTTPYSNLTSNFEFRIRYSWLTAWMRFDKILPLALVVLNVVTLLMIYYACRIVVRRFLKNNEQKYKPLIIQAGCFAASLITYFVLIYTKVTHFYTLVFGFGLFAVAVSLILVHFSEVNQSFLKNKKKIFFLIALLTLINPAIHYIVLTVFILVILALSSLLYFIYHLLIKRKKGKTFLNKFVFAAALCALISILYVIYYYFYISALGENSVSDSISLSRAVIENSSPGIFQILTLQLGATVDFHYFNNYLIDPVKRLPNILYSLTIFLIPGIYLWKKFKRKTTNNRIDHTLSISIVILIVISIFFALGLSSPISAHNVSGGFLHFLDRLDNFFADKLISAITTFFQILRFPHRFLFIYMLALTFSSALTFIYISNFIFTKIGKKLTIINHFYKISIVLMVLLFLVPFLSGEKIFYTLFTTGNYGGFLHGYTYPEDLKNIKNILQSQKKGRMLVLPSSELPYRITGDADEDQTKLIDKFYSYYLDYPTLYYGAGATKYTKSDFELIYQLLLSNQDYFYLLANKNIGYILYSKNEELKTGITNLKGTESKVEASLKSLEQKGYIENRYEGKDFTLYKFKDEYIEPKTSIYTNVSFSDLYSKPSYYSNRTVKDISRDICNEKNDFYIFGNKDKNIKDLLALCEDKSQNFDERLLPFDPTIKSTDDFMSTFSSLLTLNQSPDIFRYNTFKSINPGTYNSLNKAYIAGKDNGAKITINFDIKENGAYNLELRDKTVINDIQIKLDYLENNTTVSNHNVKIFDPENFINKKGQYVFDNFGYHVLISNQTFKKGKYRISITKLDDKPLAMDNFILYKVNEFQKYDIYFDAHKEGDNLYKINLKDLLNTK